MRKTGKRFFNSIAQTYNFILNFLFYCLDFARSILKIQKGQKDFSLFYYSLVLLSLKKHRAVNWMCYRQLLGKYPNLPHILEPTWNIFFSNLHIQNWTLRHSEKFQKNQKSNFSGGIFYSFVGLEFSY